MNNHKPVVGIYFSNPNIDGSPLKSLHYGEAYRQFMHEIENQGGKPVVVRSMSTYTGGGKFSKHWELDDDDNFVEAGGISVDVIYDKGTFEDDRTVPVLNDTRLREICKDKFATYDLLSDFQPKTVLAGNREDMLKAVSSTRDVLVVVKPLAGVAGDNVHIVEPKEVKDLEIKKYPVLVQQFIDTSQGIPGLVAGIHDLRVVVQNGEIIDSYIRSPKPGSLRSNLHQGGNYIPLTLQQVPNQIVQMSSKIDSVFSKYPERCYGADFVLGSDNNWYLIELNSMPGMIAESMSKQNAKYYNSKLASQLVRMANNGLQSSNKIV